MFGQKLKELRKKNLLTQVALGQKIGVSPSAIGMYEQGHREPDYHTLLKICDLFNVSTDYLINTTQKCAVFFNPNCEHDITSMVTTFVQALAKQKNVTYKGEKLDLQDVQKITDAIKMAVAYALNKDGFK